MKTDILILFSSLLVITSCQEGGKTSNEKDKGEEYVSAIASGNESEEELQKRLEEYENQEVQRMLEKQKSLTSLKFDKKRHDFGNVGPGSDNTCEFVVTNTGQQPLIIEKVSASCGCTTPKKPEKPILPGQSDVIQVGFHPKPRQVNEIIKEVTVVANTDPKESKVEIRAFVTAAK
ncbi:MAG: DUF1573 domain-containing protein [Bacteroidetes bacterium]|nr:MAG: DUF1573 domain-containing protein [Bacteroidota bacterium]